MSINNFSSGFVIFVISASLGIDTFVILYKAHVSQTSLVQFEMLRIVFLTSVNFK